MPAKATSLMPLSRIGSHSNVGVSSPTRHRMPRIDRPIAQHRGRDDDRRSRCCTAARTCRCARRQSLDATRDMIGPEARRPRHRVAGREPGGDPVAQPLVGHGQRRRVEPPVGPLAPAIALQGAGRRSVGGGGQRSPSAPASCHACSARSRRCTASSRSAPATDVTSRLARRERADVAVERRGAGGGDHERAPSRPRRAATAGCPTTRSRRARLPWPRSAVSITQRSYRRRSMATTTSPRLGHRQPPQHANLVAAEHLHVGRGANRGRVAADSRHPVLASPESTSTERLGSASSRTARSSAPGSTSPSVFSTLLRSRCRCWLTGSSAAGSRMRSAAGRRRPASSKPHGLLQIGEPVEADLGGQAHDGCRAGRRRARRGRPRCRRRPAPVGRARPRPARRSAFVSVSATSVIRPPTSMD